MVDSLVKFVATSALAYASASSLDENTLYFVTDERRIYKGSVPYSGGIYKEVDSVPAKPVVNVLYYVKTTGQVVFCDGSKTVTLVAPYSTSLGASSTNNELATAKSVVDYVSSIVSDLDVGKISSQVTTNKTNIETLQNNVSTLTGSGNGSVAKTLADAKNYTDSAKAALQTSINGKANSATSLAGYGIKDAYTKTQVDTAISSAVANAHHLKREIVASLPAASQANEDTIYMVPTSGSTSDAGSVASTYTEYMLINGGFERIGTSDVDLSNYATKNELSTAKTEAINSATTKADNALSSAKSYANGLAVNYATAAQGAKADSALQSTDIATGTSNGSISVKGTNVSVKGLGTAAYTASSAYDAAGAADKALAQAKAYAATAAQGAKADSVYSAITWGAL